jgi:hypothetical protein
MNSYRRQPFRGLSLEQVARPGCASQNGLEVFLRRTVLGFSTGEEIIDLVRAVIAQRGHGVEEPIAILSPNDKVSIKVITFDPFQDADGAKSIKVLVRWRSIKRGVFSRSSVSSKIQVRDMRDLKLGVERRQPRIRYV